MKTKAYTMDFSRDVLNLALSLALEWGDDWLTSIKKGLSKVYPELKQKEIKVLEKLCKEVMEFSNEAIFKNPVNINGGVTFMAFDKFSALLFNEYNWTNENNCGKLYSQACYYVRK